ncbi:MAG: protein kinase domain-containing protein, partial [Candidatus Acidiferrum sp.]
GVGTPQYVSPEQDSGQFGDRIAGRSDLYALGVLLYEMLTGRLPYPAGTLRQTLRRHACDPPARIRRRMRELPPVLIALVARLLAHDPDHRPRADQVVQHLVKLEIALLNGKRAA